MKAKRTAKDLPFKIKCNDPKQAEAVIWGGGGGTNMPENRHSF